MFVRERSILGIILVDEYRRPFPLRPSDVFNSAIVLYGHFTDNGGLRADISSHYSV